MSPTSSSRSIPIPSIDFRPPPPPYSANPPNLSSPSPQQGNPQQTPAQQQQPQAQAIPNPQPYAQYYYPFLPQGYTARPQYYPVPSPQIPIYTYPYPVSPPVLYHAYPAFSASAHLPSSPPPQTQLQLQLQHQYSQPLHLQPQFITQSLQALQPQPQTPPPTQGPQNGNGNMQIIPYPNTGFIPHPPAMIPGIPGVHPYPLIVRKEGSGPPPEPIFLDLEGGGG